MWRQLPAAAAAAAAAAEAEAEAEAAGASSCGSRHPPPAGSAASGEGDGEGDDDSGDCDGEGSDVESPPAAAAAAARPRNGSAAKPHRSTASAAAAAATDAMLLESRLDALLACDSEILTYDPSSFLIIFRASGRNLKMIAAPLLYLLLWGVLWAVIVHLYPSIRRFFEPLDDLIGPLLLPVSFLLVFRLGRAAVRYWDARAAAGKVVEICRAMSSTAAVACLATATATASGPGEYDNNDGGGGGDGPELAESFARWTCVFPIAVKNFLRPVRRRGWEEASRRNKRRLEVGPLLSDADAAELLDPDGGYAHGPILALNRLRALARRIAVGGGTKTDADAAVGAMVYRQLNQQIDVLTGACGAMERINATPLPFVYVVHLRTFLVLYLSLWHLEAIARNGWVALPVLFAGSWALLGIEAAAVECEQPFRWHSNHLALGKMCVVVAQNVAQTLRDVGAQ